MGRDVRKYGIENWRVIVMAIKLFVTDIDGTLLVTGRAISEKNLRAVHEMIDAGVIFTLATGRMYGATLPIARALGVEASLISYNGALIKTTAGEVIHEETLPKDLALALIEFGEERGWHVQTYAGDRLRYARRNELSDGYELAVNVKGEAVGWDGLKKFSAGSYKILLVTNGTLASDEAIKILTAEFGDRIDALKSNPQYVEITSKGVSKASAIKILAARYGLTIEETLAIGDSGNDIPMIRAAGVGVAMGNASADVKAACDYVTGLCADDGFAAAVDRFVFNR